MKYLIPLLLVLSGCNEAKSVKYVCMSAIGPAAFDSADPSVKITHQYISVEQDDKVLKVNRAVCVEISDK